MGQTQLSQLGGMLRFRAMARNADGTSGLLLTLLLASAPTLGKLFTLPICKMGTRKLTSKGKHFQTYW